MREIGESILTYVRYWAPESHAVLASKTTQKGLAAQRVLGVYRVIVLGR